MKPHMNFSYGEEFVQRIDAVPKLTVCPIIPVDIFSLVCGFFSKAEQGCAILMLSLQFDI